MNNCIKCGVPTLDKTKVKTPFHYINLCRSHRADLAENKVIIEANKKIFRDYSLSQDSTLNETIKNLLLNAKAEPATNFNVYAHFLDKKEIKVMSQEEVETLHKEKNNKVEEK